MLYHSFLVIPVVCQKIVPKQCAVCRLEFFNLLFCIFVRWFLGFLLWLPIEWFSVPLVLVVFQHFYKLFVALPYTLD